MPTVSCISRVIEALLTCQGIAVSASGRRFSNYARSLDPNNNAYTVAELTSNNTEIPYPSAELNSQPGGPINYTTNPATGANYQDYLIGVQSVVIDPKDRLWILDTGRAAMQNGTNVPASPGRSFRGSFSLSEIASRATLPRHVL